MSVDYDSKGNLENAKLSPRKLLREALDCLRKLEDKLMSWITLQTTSGPEEYQISDLDEVVWWKTENGMIAVGYMDMVSGFMSLSDLEACRMKRSEIVHESMGQQPNLLRNAN
jgi:hypothetical protein